MKEIPMKAHKYSLPNFSPRLTAFLLFLSMFLEENMKKFLMIFLAAILSLVCLVSCNNKEEAPQNHKSTVLTPFDEGLVQENDRPLLETELIDSVKEHMYAHEVYEHLGNPHLYIPNRTSSLVLTYAYYKMDDEKVLEIAYEHTMQYVEEEDALRHSRWVVSTRDVSLEEFESIEQEELKLKVDTP